MKKNNTLITAVLYFILTMAGCGNNVEKKFAENQAKKFQEVMRYSIYLQICIVGEMNMFTILTIPVYKFGCGEVELELFI